jgi:hypothetical protein
MIGYATGEDDSWHLAFVKLGDGNARGLWVLPASSCTCLSHNLPTESISTLTSEFQRFARSKRGVAISLFQHPRNFGPLMLGEGANLQDFVATSRCRGITGNSPAAVAQVEACEIKKILQEIGVRGVCLEYPCALEWKKGRSVLYFLDRGVRRGISQSAEILGQHK